MLKKKWLKINSYPYLISNYGEIKSLITNKLLKFELVHRGYYRVRLSFKGASKRFLVHRLVAQYFLNNKNKDLIVNHKDFNQLNNVVTNLEWCSQKQNCQHAARDGRYIKKINFFKRCEIIKKYLDGSSPYKISKDYNLNYGSVRYILSEYYIKPGDINEI